MRSIAVLLVALGGCDQLFKLSEVAGVDMGPPCTVETFSGTTAEVSLNWDRLADYDTCRAITSGDELVFEIDAAMRCYAELQSIKKYSLVGARATVKVTAVPVDGPTELSFALWLDDENWYYFDYGRGYLDTRVEQNDTGIGIAEVAYDPLVHVYWRIEHRPDLARVVFSTSPDGQTFVERNSVEALVPLEMMKIEFSVGAYDPLAMATTARFDDFELCLP